MGSFLSPVENRLGYAYDWLLDTSSQRLNLNIEVRFEDYGRYIQEIFYSSVFIGLGFIFSGVKLKLVNNCVVVEISLYSSISIGWKLRARLAVVEKRVLLAGYVLFKTPIKVMFYVLDDSNVSAMCIVNFVYLRVKNGVYINEVFKELQYYLRRLYLKDVCTGYKVLCKGRFSRKQRAQKKVLISGALPIQNLSLLMDMSQKCLVMTYGVSNLKVWLFRKKVEKLYSMMLIV